MKCGTLGQYIHGRCRCEDCRGAARKQTRRYRKKRGDGPKLRGPCAHGSYAMWKSGCRCDECRAAIRSASRVWRVTAKQRREKERRKCVEIAVARGLRMLRLPGNRRDQFLSMLGHATILQYRFVRLEPWNPARFVAWAAPKVRDELARDFGLKRTGTTFKRREVSLDEIGDRLPTWHGPPHRHS